VYIYVFMFSYFNYSVQKCDTLVLSFYSHYFAWNFAVILAVSSITCYSLNQPYRAISSTPYFAYWAMQSLFIQLKWRVVCQETIIDLSSRYMHHPWSMKKDPIIYSASCQFFSVTTIHNRLHLWQHTLEIILFFQGTYLTWHTIYYLFHLHSLIISYRISLPFLIISLNYGNNHTCKVILAAKCILTVHSAGNEKKTSSELFPAK
jgi:hypothetical protein